MASLPYQRQTRGQRTTVITTVIEDVKDEFEQVDLRVHEAFADIPLFIRVKGSIFPHIVLPVCLFAIYSAIYVFLGVGGVLPDFGSTLIPILSMVTGLMVSFRTSSAYERWSEGRRVWESIQTLVRNVTRVLWLSRNHTYSLHKNDTLSTEFHIIMRLPAAFAVAVKHHLRSEKGPNFDDLHDYLPVQFVERLGVYGGPDNLPLEVLMLLQNYLITLRTEERLEVHAFSAISGCIDRMVEVLGSAERILTTPIPLAYAIHLKQMITLYCLSLPPQLVGTLGIWSIPATCIAVFTFFGIDALGREIENPFGFDDNDLPLDRYCDELKAELESVLEQPLLDVTAWRKKGYIARHGDR